MNWGATGAALAFCGVLADAARCDLAAFRIPNRDPLLLVLAVVPYWLDGGSVVGGVWAHVGAALLVLVAGALLMSLNVWGGGDAKLLAAVTLWTGFAGLPRLLLVMAVAGGAIAAALLVLRRLLPADRGGWPRRVVAEGYVPYGVAIALAGLDWAVPILAPR
ncbi:MAG: prepilin peptidase [Magnetospirillum sp.]|nr:prepilin peptidase [Magnetospirillum sp.]